MSQFLGPVSYLGDVSGVGPSGSIWHDLPDNIADKNVGVAIDVDPGKGFTYLDASGGALTSNISIGPSVHGLYAYQGGTILDGALAGGAIAIGSDGDNEGVAFLPQAGQFKITAGQGKLWFEAAIATSTIADTKHNLFVGLIEPLTPTTALPLTTSDILADKNLIGFARLVGSGTALQSTYKNSGQTIQVSIAAAATLVAATVVKVGFKYDPRKRGADKAIAWYVNGVEQSTYVTATQIAAATFPNDTFLGFCFGVMNATGSAPGTSTLKWAKVAQQFA